MHANYVANMSINAVRLNVPWRSYRSQLERRWKCWMRGKTFSRKFGRCIFQYWKLRNQWRWLRKYWLWRFQRIYWHWVLSKFWKDHVTKQLFICKNICLTTFEWSINYIVFELIKWRVTAFKIHLSKEITWYRVSP